LTIITNSYIKKKRVRHIIAQAVQTFYKTDGFYFIYIKTVRFVMFIQQKLGVDVILCPGKMN